MASVILGLPSLAVSAIASSLYASFGAIWLATEGPRATLLSTSQSAAAIVAKAALQLAVSLLLSLTAYAAIYAAFVPEAGIVNDLHFGLCQPPLVAATAAASTNAPTLPMARVARLNFEADAAPFYLAREAVSAASAAGLGTIATPLARAYDYRVELCLRLPESPPNVAAGTFVASIRIVSESNATLLAASRPLVLRYRSAQLSYMRTWFYALPLLFGWMDESQLLCATLAEAFTNLRNEPARRATVALASPGACELQLYGATLSFGVRLGGVTRAMSQYFFASAALGVGSLMVLHWIAMLLFELRPAAPSPSARRRAAEDAADGARARRTDDAFAAADAAARAAYGPLDEGPDDDDDDFSSFARTGDLHDGLRHRTR